MKHTLNLPRKVYFRAGCLPVALRELPEIYGCKRVYLITDAKLYRMGTVSGIGDFLRCRGIRTAEYFSLSGTACLTDVEAAFAGARLFEPDAILGVGGAAVLDAAKAVWLRCECPELTLPEAAEEPDRIVPAGKTKLALVSTNFAAGAQTSPFAVLEKDGKPLVIKSFSLRPEIAVTDADFTKSLTPEQVADGARALSLLALRAFTDEKCNEYTQGLLAEAIRAVISYTESAAAGNPAAREKLHNASALTGAAVGNVLDAAELAAYVPTLPPAEHPRIAYLAERLFQSPAELLAKLSF